MQKADAGIRDLNVASAEFVYVDDALQSLSSAYSRSKATEADIQESINDVIQSINSLLKITSADVTEAVKALDDLLTSYEGMWYFYEMPSH